MQNLYIRLKGCLSKTYQQLGNGISCLLLGKKTVDPEIYTKLEELLLKADLGIKTVNKVMQNLTTELKRYELKDGNAILQIIKAQLAALLEKSVQSNFLQNIALNNSKTFVILVVGVNGTGKTTTIGKLAQHLQQQNKKVMLAAGDTFRAAATEQLQEWGMRNNIPVIAQQVGADSASVIYDALQAAQVRGMDVLIADTAGRLHTQNNLIVELQKIKRVMQKLDPDAPHEIMLVLDANIGQNALNQAQEFHNALGVTGITMTKLDGTAKGGIVFAIADVLKIPLRYLGVGENIDDLQVFNSEQFIKAIFDAND